MADSKPLTMTEFELAEKVTELYLRDKILEVLGSQPLPASAIAERINAKYPGSKASGQSLAKPLNSLKLQGKVAEDGAEAGSKKWHKSVLPIDRIAEAIAKTDEVQPIEGFRRLADTLWKKAPPDVQKLLKEYAVRFESVQRDKTRLQEHLAIVNQL